MELSRTIIIAIAVIIILWLIKYLFNRQNNNELMISRSVSFKNDIRPLFNDNDIQAMKSFGLNLSKYEDVKEWSTRIYSRLVDGSMPCYGAWPKKNVQLFKKWIEDGYMK